MSALMREWIEKAEQDFNVVQLLLDPVKGTPAYDVICFHCQQCIEKYIKGYLVSVRIEFPKVHDLTALLDLALPYQPLWEAYRNSLERVSSYAVEFRYPGESATREQASRAFDICKSIRMTIRKILDLG